MTLMSKTVTQVLNLFKDAKAAILADDQKRFADIKMQIDAILNQHLQMVDEEFQTTHNLRKQVVQYVDNLVKCKEYVASNSEKSSQSNFEGLETSILDAARDIFLLEYELKNLRPESNLLRDD